MAKQEWSFQESKPRDTSTLRNRKVCPSTEQTDPDPVTPASKGKTSQTDGHLLEDDTKSSNVSAAHLSTRGRDVFPTKVGLMLVVGLSFATRLYKISDPPHIW